MNKQIKQIRQSIRERKKQRHFERQVKQPIVRHETITDEERHGFYNETFHQETPTKKGEEIRIFSSSLGLQFFGALLFIGFCAFIFQTELRTLEKPKQLLEEALTERSEEHTSELQSRGHLVCRLLLEKKKNTKKNKCRPHH